MKDVFILVGKLGIFGEKEVPKKFLWILWERESSSLGVPLGRRLEKSIRFFRKPSLYD